MATAPKTGKNKSKKPSQIQLTCLEPLVVTDKAFVNAVTALQKKACDRLDESTESMPDANGLVKDIGKHFRVFTACDGTYGSLQLVLHYKDSEDSSCARRFPNYGMVVDGSASSVKSNGSELTIHLDVTVKAGKPKWQVDELADCVKILAGGQFSVSLELMLDSSSDPFGDAVQLPTTLDVADELGLLYIPGSKFKVACS
jgi:hypothetical protein